MKLLKFSATWCGPCRVMSNVLKPFESKNPDFITHIDIDSDEESTITWRVKSVPTLILVGDDNVELERWVGITPLATIEKALEAHSVKVTNN